jgi:hypothetical protein
VEQHTGDVGEEEPQPVRPFQCFDQERITYQLAEEKDHPYHEDVHGVPDNRAPDLPLRL